MGTVLLCIFSTLAFCLCVRGLLAVITQYRQSAVMSYSRKRAFSPGARKLAQQYMIFSLAVLAVVSAIGAVGFFIDLFIEFGSRGA